MNKVSMLTIFITVFMVTGFLVVAQTLWAHGDENHPDKNQQSSHMLAMYA